MKKLILIPLFLFIFTLAALAQSFIGNVYVPTNWVTVPTPNMKAQLQYFTTSTSFSFNNPANVRSASGQSCVFVVTNSSASIITMTPATAWAPTGTFNVTNGGYSVVTITVFEGFSTNAICVPVR